MNMNMLEEIFAKSMANSIIGFEGVKEELQNSLPCKRMTWEEITEHFPDQYVGLMYTIYNKDDELESGIVVCTEATIGYDLLYWLEMSEKIDRIAYAGEGTIVKKKTEKDFGIIDYMDYVTLIKDEVYKIWPKKEEVDLLVEYGTTFEDVKLPKDLSKEQLYELYLMVRMMWGRYYDALHILQDQIFEGELDAKMVLHKKYIGNASTRRKALMIDELLFNLEKLKNEEPRKPIKKLSEKEKENLTVKKTEQEIKGLPEFFEIPTMLFFANIERCLERASE